MNYWNEVKRIQNKLKTALVIGTAQATDIIDGITGKLGYFFRVDNDIYHAVKRDDVLKMIAELEKKGRYQLVLWPPHCITGTWGGCVHDAVNKSVIEWQKTKKRPVDYVTKGKNPLTEHYSAIEAEVPVEGDAGTQKNTAFIASLKKNDSVLVAGEALSHCVAFTVRDIASNIGAATITLLKDCSSSVAGFEQAGIDFIAELSKAGMNLQKAEN